MGTARLAELAKSGAKWAWNKAKSGAKAAYGSIKGAILGRRLPFKGGGEDHQLWVEQGGNGEPVVMVASTKMPL